MLVLRRRCHFLLASLPEREASSISSGSTSRVASSPPLPSHVAALYLPNCQPTWTCDLSACQQNPPGPCLCQLLGLRILTSCHPPRPPVLLSSDPRLMLLPHFSASAVCKSEWLKSNCPWCLNVFHLPVELNLGIDVLQFFVSFWLVVVSLVCYYLVAPFIVMNLCILSALNLQLITTCTCFEPGSSISKWTMSMNLLMWAEQSY